MRGLDLEPAQRVGIVAERVRQPNGDGEALLADQHLGELFAAVQGFDHLLNVGDVDAIPCGGGTIDADLQLLARPVISSHLCLGCALDRRDDVLCLASELLQGVEVLAEDLQRDVAAGSGDGLIHAHLHGLGELVGDAGDLVQRLLEPRGELLLLLVAGVLHLRGEGDVRVGLVLAHGLGGEVGTAELGDDALHLGEALDGALDLVTDGDGLGERDAGQPLGGDDHRTLVERRHELGADELERSQSEKDQHQGGDEDRFAVLRGVLQGAAVFDAQACRARSPCGLARAALLASLQLPGLEPQCDGAEGGNDEEREQQRTEQGRDHGDRHGAEHASLKALQGKHGQIDGDDDEHAEDHRPGYLVGGRRE